MRRHWPLFVILALDLVLIIYYSLGYSLEIPTFHLDGAYQNASALHRLYAGQYPGRDFFPYLGIGVTYSLYPLFVLLGHNMAASLFACRFVVFLALFGSGGWLLSLFFNKNRFSWFVFCGSACLFWMYYLNRDLLDPGNSLRALRATIPYIAMGLTHFILTRDMSFSRKCLAIGSLAGCSFWWSNDFGTATTLGLSLFILIYSWNRKMASLKNAMIYAFSLMASSFIILQIATHGHGIELLSFNLIDVRGDQYWYFGPWKEELRILQWSDVFTKLFLSYRDGYFWMVGFPFWAYAFRKKDPTLTIISWLGIILFLGGLIATVGGHIGYGSGSYMFYYILWCLLVSIGFSIKLLSSVIQKYHLHFLPQTVLLLTSFLALMSTGDAVFEAQRIKNKLSHDPKFFFVEELNGYLGTDWKPMVELARNNKNLFIVEEYWGLWSSINKIHAPLPVDSIIHALGRQRSRFEDIFKSNIDGIITTPIEMSKEWQPWNVSANWWFYKHLFKNFTPQKTSPTTLLWHPVKERVWPEYECKVSVVDEKPFVVLTNPQAGIYEIEVEYDASQLGARDLLMAQNILSYAAYERGSFSIPPHATKTTFPVALYPVMGKSHVRGRYGFRVISASSTISQLHLKSCRAHFVTFQSPLALPNFNY